MGNRRVLTMLKRFLCLFTVFALALPATHLLAAEKASNKKASKPEVIKVKHKPTPRKQPTVQEALMDEYDGSGILQLASSKALIVNQETGEVLFAKNTNTLTPIASVTKLMTAMVVLDAGLSMEESLTVSQDDIDTLKGTGSRLRIGTTLSRGEMLQLALIASENRAASALGRHYPGGITAFVHAMNLKAMELGMVSTHFVDSTGLNSQNISTAEDLVLLVRAAYEYPEIRQVSTTPSQEVALSGVRNPMNFVNTNSLVRKGDWVIGLSKTGYISEAGRCLVMQAEISGQPLIIVLLDSNGKQTRIGDANRIRKWIESSYLPSILG
jgi:serine-type D-Ala-D-Ala endopeptidase (penicillin-binding protein 7)